MSSRAFFWAHLVSSSLVTGHCGVSLLKSADGKNLHPANSALANRFVETTLFYVARAVSRPALNP